MNVYVPATPDGLHSSVVPAILRDGYSPTVERMPGRHSYYAFLWRHWAAGEPFCVVEHDVEVGPGTLRSLECCSHDWCAFSYDVTDGTIWNRYGRPGLGCVKFGADLIAAVPDAVERAGRMKDLGGRTWWGLDASLGRVLRRFATPHRHFPSVVHHHDYAR